MTDERIIATLGRLDAAVEPDPAFAEALFTTLVDSVEWGTMPGRSVRGRVRWVLGIGALPTGQRALRLAYVLAITALLIVALGAALFVASRLDGPTPSELVALSQAAYEHPPAFRVKYRIPIGGGITLSSNGTGTWRVEASSEGPGAYWLWDGGDRVGHFDATTREWVMGAGRDVGIVGPPGPLWAEYTWGTGEMFADDPVRHVLPCGGVVGVPDERTVLGHATDHIVCTDIGMHYWLDRESHLILRMEAGPDTPHWSGTPGVRGIVEAVAFDLGPQPVAAFAWSGPASETTPTPSPSDAAPSPPTLTVPAGLATDQPCVTPLVDTTAVAEVGIAPHEIEALLLEAEDLGVTGDEWSIDPWSSAYLHNIEVAVNGAPSEDTCAILARLGRVVGYAAGYADWDANDQLHQSVDVFLTEDGAAAYVTWYAGAVASETGGATSRPIERGDDGVEVTASTSSGDRTWIIFRVGRLVATLGFLGPTGHTPPVAFDDVGAVLAARIQDAEFTGRPYDLARLMSATVPRADLPPAFGTLGWDATFGGCWDHAEMVAQSTDPEVIADLIERYGHEVYCVGMYSPDGDCGVGGCPSPAPDALPPVGIIRVATGISVLASPSAAQGYLAATIARVEASSSSPVERFDVPGIPGAVGLRRSVVDGDVREVDTRVIFARDDLVAVAYVHDRTDADHRADVIAVAMALQARIGTILVAAAH